MVTIEHAFLIPAEIDKVFNYLANPANDAGWQLSCKHSELLDSTPRVGSKYEIGFSFIGREMSFKGEITHLVPNELYAFKVVEGPFHYTGTYRFKPHAEGTWIEWVFEAEPGSFFGVLPPALLKRWFLLSLKMLLILKHWLRRVKPMSRLATMVSKRMRPIVNHFVKLIR